MAKRVWIVRETHHTCRHSVQSLRHVTLVAGYSCKYNDPTAEIMRRKLCGAFCFTLSFLNRPHNTSVKCRPASSAPTGTRVTLVSTQLVMVQNLALQGSNGVASETRKYIVSAARRDKKQVF